MTANELIEALRKFTPEQRQRQMLAEADAGFGMVGELYIVTNDEGEETIAISVTEVS